MWWLAHGYESVMRGRVFSNEGGLASTLVWVLVIGILMVMVEQGVLNTAQLGGGLVLELALVFRNEDLVEIDPPHRLDCNCEANLLRITFEVRILARFSSHVLSSVPSTHRQLVIR